MRALKHHQMLYKVNRRLVTTQAHEGIETAVEGYTGRRKAGSTQAREGIETRDKSNASFSETRNNSSP